MVLSSPTRSAVYTLALTIVAAAASAQERRLTSVDSVMPVALFQAFTQGTSPRSAARNETSVMVGRIPAGVATRLPELPNASILGMISMPYYDLVALEAPGSPESIRARIVESLPQRGWRTPSALTARGGFVRPREESRVWCGESSTLDYGVQAISRERVRVIYRLVQSDQGLCSPNRGAPGRELPTLYDPEEARTHAPECNHGATSGGVSSTMEFVASALAPTAFLDHFARQLADSGWRPVPSTGEGALVRRTWRLPAAKTDTATRPPTSSGSPVEPEERLLTITVQVPEGKPRCRVLEMRMDSQVFR